MNTTTNNRFDEQRLAIESIHLHLKVSRLWLCFGVIVHIVVAFFVVLVSFQSLSALLFLFPWLVSIYYWFQALIDQSRIREIKIDNGGIFLLRFDSDGNKVEKQRVQIVSGSVILYWLLIIEYQYDRPFKELALIDRQSKRWAWISSKLVTKAVFKVFKASLGIGRQRLILLPDSAHTESLRQLRAHVKVSGNT